MQSTLTIKFFVMLALVIASSARRAESSDRMLFSFDKKDVNAQWRVVNDGVMGGRSKGRLAVSDEQTLAFYGTLSLENNGGFSSIRAYGTKLGLTAGTSVVARVRGDGREYGMNLYTPGRRMAYSYRSKFKTTKDQWIEVRLPLEEFQATWFGRVLPNEKLNPEQVNGLGIIIADKKAGPFKLEVDWVKVSSSGD